MAHNSTQSDRLMGPQQWPLAGFWQVILTGEIQGRDSAGNVFISSTPTSLTLSIGGVVVGTAVGKANFAGYLPAAAGGRSWLVHRTVTITSAAAITPVIFITDAEVVAAGMTGAKAYLMSFVSKVNGVTAWATTATVKLQDTSAVDFVTVAVAAMTGNAVIFPQTANVTSENAYALGSGGTASKGMQLKGDANGTGSDYTVTVSILYKV